MKNNAFSLVELSIVLVILGLLTGGILAGQNLIRAAELRSVVTEFNKYQTASYTFRDKYFALPGDMRNAADFWGYPGANSANCPATAGTGTQTCNGNGDGIIDAAAAASQYGEVFMYWQHLANAGLIEGTYDGIANSGGGGHMTIGDNVPASKFPNTGWGIANLGNFVGNGTIYALDYGNYLHVGADVANGGLGAAAFTPEEAWNIDTKVDDGKPAQGRVIARHWNDACAAADNGTHSKTNLEASYKLSDSSVQCMLQYVRLF